MALKITVESTLSGPAAGYQVQTLDASATVDSVISCYCIYKGIRQKPRYVLRSSDNIILDNLKSLAAAGVRDGDHLFLSTGAEEDQTFGFNNWWILVVVSLFIGTVGLAASITIFTFNGKVPFDYGVVFDAGSTHTMMQVYHWKGDKWKGTGIVQQVAGCRSKGEGISSFLHNTSQVSEYLAPCLKVAEEAVPVEKRSQVPLYLGATAGMRLANQSSPAAASVIMENIRKLFAASSLKFSDDQASLISGEEEGISSWVTVNYLSHNFEKYPRTRMKMQTVGAMDLGGASTQISVELPNVNMSQPDHVSQVKIFGRNYSVYVRSFLCFGVVEALRRYQMQLIQSPNETTVVSPCGPKGHNISINFEDLFDTPCTQSASEEISKMLAEVNKMKLFTFMGSSDWHHCQSQMQQLLNTTSCKDVYRFHNCFQMSDSLPLSGMFMAFSTYPYIVAALNVTSTTPLEQYVTAMQRVCTMTWEQLKQLPGLDDDVLEVLCFEAQFMYSLLTEGYGFTNKTWNNIQFVYSISGTDVGWSLGFMLNKTNAIPAEPPVELLDVTVFVLLVILFVIFLITAALFMYHALKLRKRSLHYQRWSSYGSVHDNLL